MSARMLSTVALTFASPSATSAAPLPFFRYRAIGLFSYLLKLWLAFANETGQDSSRSSTRLIFPEMVLGRLSRKTISLGYLYGAVVSLT